jgi:hypothetical protein
VTSGYRAQVLAADCPDLHCLVTADTKRISVNIDLPHPPAVVNNILAGKRPTQPAVGFIGSLWTAVASLSVDTTLRLDEASRVCFPQAEWC